MVKNRSAAILGVLLQTFFCISYWGCWIKYAPSWLASVGILKMVHQGSRPLNSSVGQFTNLLAVKSIPSSAVKLLVKLHDKLGVNEVDESVAHIARVEVVNGKIQKVNFDLMIFANLLQQHFL